MDLHELHRVINNSLGPLPLLFDIFSVQRILDESHFHARSPSFVSSFFIKNKKLQRAWVKINYFSYPLCNLSVCLLVVNLREYTIVLMHNSP